LNNKIGITTKLYGITEIEEIKVNLNNKIEAIESDNKKDNKSIKILITQI
jgi:hypothetical protein